MSQDTKTSDKQVTLPLLPLRDLIIFPHMMMPLFVGRDRSIRALEEAMNNQTDIVLVAQKVKMQRQTHQNQKIFMKLEPLVQLFNFFVYQMELLRF